LYFSQQGNIGYKLAAIERCKTGICLEPVPLVTPTSLMGRFKPSPSDHVQTETSITQVHPTSLQGNMTTPTSPFRVLQKMP
jgi:hypothetical protein